MTSVVLIPWAETDWSSQGRLAANTPLALNQTGRRRALDWANELASRELASGVHRLPWDGAGLPSGVYFGRLATPHQSADCRIVLAR